MKKIIILLCLVLLILTGCSNKYTLYGIDNTRVVKENKSLKRQLKETNNIIHIKRSKFTDKEWGKVINTVSTINILITKYNTIAQLKSSEINITDIEFLWQLTMEGFYQTKSVVITKYPSMDPSSQIMLKSFDARVSEIDLELIKLITNPTEGNVNKALILIVGILNNSAKMIGTIATQL